MPTLSIRGIEVEFPKDPYPCQIDYMTKVISALQSGNNALLESPTGTGKSLCLLCSCLAWQNHQRQLAAAKEVAINQTKPTLSTLLKPFKPSNPFTSKILFLLYSFTFYLYLYCIYIFLHAVIYASRTHSQLAQVIGELRTTSYTKSRVAVLGSREQLCVHEKISKLSSSALNHSCNRIASRHACTYQNNLENYTGGSEGVGGAAAPIHDIEDLVKLGHTDKICPYFHSRNNAEKADIIFLPYNYLLDTSIRATLKVDWTQCIVIFDEAHNIEKIAADAASCSLSSTDIAGCISELKKVLEFLQTNGEALEQAMGEQSSQTKAKTNNQQSVLDMSKLPTSSETSSSRALPTIRGVSTLLNCLFELEKQLDRVPLEKGKVGDSVSNVLPGDWLPATLNAIGLTFTEVGVIEY